MKRLSILFLIFLVIAISGCVGQDGISVSAKDGIVITDFSFDHSPIYAKDNIRLHLEIQNVGGSVARLEKIQIYGVDFRTTERDWDIKGNEILELDKELYQPDPVLNVEGEMDYYEWGLQAPIDVTAETDYDFWVRVEYDYETVYSGTIRIINDNYLQTLSEEDRQNLFSKGGVISSELTNGPISVTPYTGRHFIVSPEDGDTERTMKFKIENVGKGYTYVDDMTNKYHIRIKKIEGDRDVIVNCSKEDDWDIKLSAGKSHTIECEFRPPTDVVNKIDKPFQITFGYTYYVDDSTSITVKPVF